MSPHIPLFVLNKLQLFRKTAFCKKTIRSVASSLFVTLVFIGCSGSDSRNSGPSQIEPAISQEPANATGNTVGTLNSATNRTQPTNSMPTNNSPQSQLGQGSVGRTTLPGSPSSQNGPASAISTPSTSFAPVTTLRFVPFQCIAQIRETSQQPATNAVAIRVDVSVTGTSISTIFLEAISSNQRDRKAVAVSNTGMATTQLVVAAGQSATVTVYATSDFEPDARMCSTTR